MRGKFRQFPYSGFAFDIGLANYLLTAQSTSNIRLVQPSRDIRTVFSAAAQTQTARSFRNRAARCKDCAPPSGGAVS